MPEGIPGTAPPLPAVQRHLRTVRHPFDLAAVVSLVVLVPPPQRAGTAAVVALAVLAAAVVVVPAVRRSAWPWIVFTLFHGATYVRQWYLLDNHDALVAYWAAALAVAAASRAPDELLATQARLLLGLTFALATTWKLLSGQFLNGDFFTLALLVDPRFRGVTEVLAHVSMEQVHANATAMLAAARAMPPGTVTLAGADAIERIARTLTAGTIIVEGAVAVTMLGPRRWFDDLHRSAVLAVFLVGTYLIVPVSRFGVLLAAMAVAQATERPRMRLGFAVGAVLLVVWGSLWESLAGLA